MLLFKEIQLTRDIIANTMDVKWQASIYALEVIAIEIAYQFFNLAGTSVPDQT